MRRSPNPAIRIAGTASALAMRSVPRRMRFRAIVALSRIVTRAIMRIRPYRRELLLIDGPREVTLYRMLDVLSRYECAFDPDVDIEGLDDALRALDSPHGALLIGPHAMLGTLALRILHDAGHSPLVFAADETFPILGKQMPSTAVYPSFNALLRARATLRAGGFVGSFVDHRSNTPTDHPLPNGHITIAEGLFHLGVKMRSEFIFLTARLEGPRVRVFLKTADAETRSSVERLVTNFVRLTREHAEATAANA